MSHEERCLDKYFGDNCQVISTSTKIDHDGYDRYGPKSNLYDFAVLFLKYDKIYYTEFHREYWYHGEDDEEYGLLSNDMFDRCISDELKAIGYYSSEEVLELNSILNNKFIDLVAANILEKIIKTSYLPEMLSLKKHQNISQLMKLSNYYRGFSLYLKY